MFRAGQRSRWVVRHGVARWALAAASRAGNPIAQVMYQRARTDRVHELQTRIREQELGGGRLAMATGRHDLVSEILRDPGFEAGASSSAVARFALEAGLDPGARGPLDTPSLLVIDAPDHTRLRRLVSSVFTPRAVADLEPVIRKLTGQLLDELETTAVRDGSVDLVQHFAKRLPVSVIAHLLAVPPEMLDQFLEWSDRGSPSLDLGLPWSEFADADDAVAETNRWLVRHFATLREAPGDDLLSALVQLVDTGGDRLSETELMAVVQLLLAAGFVTIVDMLSMGLVLLLQHPDQLASLRADPAGWPNAVEEILRYESPVQITARFSARPRQLAGRTLPRGQAVLTMLGGANRDPRVFADPDRFDVTRANAREHVAFSRGIHHCLGAGLARLEGRIAFQTIVERYPDLALAGPPVPRPGAVLRGYASVPLRLFGS